MDEYTVCDRCDRKCPVTMLRCAAGRKRYQDVTGKEYVPPRGIEEDDGAAYRRIIRERRARRGKASE